MKRIVAGIVAHVDAGKTTLSEALLYRSGEIRTLGRVDHGDAFLDTNALERDRGVTIFAHQAAIHYDDLEMTLLDTPGHVDFAAETERVLRVLDYAIVVVSGVDGVQGHTETLWRLLERYRVPTFLFVNKCDAVGVDRDAVLDGLRRRLSDACFAFDETSVGDELEDLAMQDESAMEEFLNDGGVGDDRLCRMIADRKVFPVFFGSALKLEGVDEFLRGLARWTREPSWPEEFGARVFKISHDAQHHRLTWLRVTGGTLRAKEPLTVGGAGESPQKVDQLRIYNGSKHRVVMQVPAGAVCAATGLEGTFPGQGLGAERDAAAPRLQPVLTYRVLPRGDATSDGRPASFDDPTLHRVLTALHELEDEDPLLHVVWQERLQEIHVQLMGVMQLEIIERLLRDRFGLSVGFGPGSVLYKETITKPVEGVGHFEPLRHYAECHLKLEPAEPGSGIHVASALGEDDLSRNWQRLIMTHVMEREHLGVLTGFPLTDMTITLVAARAHDKHTEGGDFRQATYRAIRQGLMALHAQDPHGCQLLEPWYAFRLEIPVEMVGRAMADVQRMSGEFDPVRTEGADGFATLVGAAPVSEMRDYAMDVGSYTHGRGRFSATFGGYRPCHNASEVIADIGYDPESDPANTPDSVFCAHGAGYPVKWYRVPEFMHLDWGFAPQRIPVADRLGERNGADAAGDGEPSSAALGAASGRGAV